METEPEEDSIPQTAEYSAPEPRRRSRESHRRVAPSHRRLRRLYFAIAAIWGFLSGAVGVGAALAVRGRPVGIEDPLVLLALLPAIALAVAGGVVIAAAYRAARRRFG